jgi:large subunit ribosomal protein L37Ae
MTKKVGTTGRYGPRYVTKTKKVVLEMENKEKQARVCPYCERPALKRIAAGIWYCKKCKTKFAGGAYFPKSG